MRKNHKIGVIVPYRDRYKHLQIFKKRILNYFENSGIDFEIIIVEQDNAKLFNRGMLLNIGFTYAEKLGCDYVVFHDVDMIPVSVDYSYSDFPIHLATGFMWNKKIDKIIFDTYFGGITLFSVKDFKKINGFSNKYWGWGFEDDDLLLRCRKHNLGLNELRVKHQGDYRPGLKFNGKNSYIRGKNVFNLNRNISFFISFYPDDIICNHKKMSDVYTVFSIPGYDTAISFNSYSRYNFCTFDKNKKALYVNSNIKTNYQTTMCVTFNKKSKLITVYQDGIKIGEVKRNADLMSYEHEEYFYLGSGNPLRKDDPNYFRGHIEEFQVYSDIFSDDDVKNYHKIKNQHPLILSYSTKNIENYELVDLSGNDNNGEIVNCEIINKHDDEYKIIQTPHRRKSMIFLLAHEENGFVGNGWKNDLIRWNQLRYYNEVSLNDELLLNDGLSTLQFAEHGVETEEKITKIVVGI